MVVDIDEGSRSSDDLQNEYDVIQNFKTTSSDNVGDDEEVKNRITRWPCGSQKKVIGILQERKQ